MERQVDDLLTAFESGTLSRRQLIAGLTALATGVGAGKAGAQQSTFRATGLNHIALRVTDVARSRDFYVEHLGLEVTSESPSNCFLDCGDQFVALFRSPSAGLAHYCYSIPDYDQQDAARRLREVGLAPRLQGGRIYFDDPDGLEVQLASERHGP